MKQKEYFGHGSIENLKSILERDKPKNIFLVTGNNSYVSSGAEKALNKILGSYHVKRFHGFETDPKLEEVEDGISLFNQGDYDFMVAIGGGSVIDTAKLINTFSANKGRPIDYITKELLLKNKGVPLVAIPTTAGSGSEATHFAVIYNDKAKFSVAHENILPDYAILDYQFTKDLPAGITASTGIDALSQAVEACWSINSTEESNKYAQEAILLIQDRLRDAVINIGRKSREEMMKASNLAGKAINITKTTAPHAISYILTSKFGIPHGHAVGLTLGKMLVYNSLVTDDDINDPRGSEYVRQNIEDLCRALGAKTPM